MSTHQVMVEAARTATVVAAWRSGLLSRLERGTSSCGALASELGLHEEATRLVLEALAAFGLAERTEGGWRAAPCITERGAAENVDELARLYAHLPTLLASGETVRVDRDESYVRVTPRLGEMFQSAAEALAAALPAVDGLVLDVGAGSAVWSLAMVARSPDARAVALDSAAVHSAARARASSLGLSARLDTLAADFTTVELAAGTYARIVVANVLHLEPAHVCERLLARIAPALRPGGELVVVDVLAASPERAAFVASYALHLRLRRDGARVHPATEIADWLERAGCNRPRLVSLDSHVPGMGALVATIRG